MCILEDQSADQVRLDVKFIVQISAITPSPILFLYKFEKNLKQVSHKSSSLVYHLILLFKTDKSLFQTGQCVQLVYIVHWR